MENKEQDTFSYTYSAQENQEVLEIRKKYLQHEETEIEELRRLDKLVQETGTMEALSVGIIGSLIFCLGMCLSLGVIGNIMWIGIIIGIVGAIIMIAAYPIRSKMFKKAKEKHVARILELTDKLSKK